MAELLIAALCVITALAAGASLADSWIAGRSGLACLLAQRAQLRAGGGPAFAVDAVRGARIRALACAPHRAGRLHARAVGRPVLMPAPMPVALPRRARGGA